ncbi:MAG: hypothetical protein ACYSTT_13360 [Planctomycetota bacterium]|jgi:hypothetical protein
MENANVIGKKDRILICGLICIFLIVQSFSVVFAGSPPFPDDFKVSDYFSFFGSGGIDWQALHDPNNNPRASTGRLFMIPTIIPYCWRA